MPLQTNSPTFFLAFSSLMGVNVIPTMELRSITSEEGAKNLIKRLNDGEYIVKVLPDLIEGYGAVPDKKRAMVERNTISWIQLYQGPDSTIRKSNGEGGSTVSTTNGYKRMGPLFIKKSKKIPKAHIKNYSNYEDLKFYGDACASALSRYPHEQHFILSSRGNPTLFPWTDYKNKILDQHPEGVAILKDKQFRMPYSMVKNLLQQSEMCSQQ